MTGQHSNQLNYRSLAIFRRAKIEDFGLIQQKFLQSEVQDFFKLFQGKITGLPFMGLYVFVLRGFPLGPFEVLIESQIIAFFVSMI